MPFTTSGQENRISPVLTHLNVQPRTRIIRSEKQQQQLARNRYERRLTSVDIVDTVTPDKPAANSEIVLRNDTINRDSKAIHIADISPLLAGCGPEGKDTRRFIAGQSCPVQLAVRLQKLSSIHIPSGMKMHKTTLGTVKIQPHCNSR